MDSGGSTQEVSIQGLYDVMQQNLAQRQDTSTDRSNLEAPAVASDRTLSPDFLKIVPCNNRAKLAFHELYAKKGSLDLSEHHAQFLFGTGVGPLEKTEPLQNMSSDEASDSHQEDDDNQIINLGHFRVSFECPGIGAKATWSLGRGSHLVQKPHRGVDILLAANRFGRSQNILDVHAFLHFHFESGIWKISATARSDRRATKKGATTAAETVATVFIDDQEIFGGQSWCLTKPQTRLQIQSMEYLIEFTITETNEINVYRKTRDAFLWNQGIEPPRTRVTGIPLPNDITVRDLAIYSKGIASGTFGSVYQGIEPFSGDLRAVKVVEIKKGLDVKALEPELKVTDELSQCSGLVRQYGWQTSDGDKKLNIPFPFNVYIVMEMGSPFYHQDWREQEWAAIDTRLRLTRDLLTGLASIHTKGWMHRDITRQNILVFKARPEQPRHPRAALCDFGKLCTQRESNVTTLAAWLYLPPEIVPRLQRNYNQSIDIWMLALALVLAWYPQAEKGAARGPENQLTITGIEQIRARLLQLDESGLTTLLRSMLFVTPQDRPTASAALQDPCFRNLDVEARKMARMSEDDDDDDDDDEEDENGEKGPGLSGFHTYQSQEL